jgi:DNA polymerase-3 subunit delta'
MHALPVAQVEAALVSVCGCEPGRARLLARLSAGRIGWAIQAAEDETVRDQRSKLVERLIKLGMATRVDRLAFAFEQSQRYGKEVAGRQSVHAVLDQWSTWWRDVLLTQEGCPDLVVNADRLEILQREAGRHSPQEARGFLDVLTQAGKNLRQNVNPRLALEVLVLAVPQGKA